VQICRDDADPAGPGYADSPRLRTSATEAELARALARHLTVVEGVRRVYVRGDSEETPTRALVEALRAAKAEVRVDHAGPNSAEPGSVVIEGIRDFRPDAVFLQGTADQLTTGFEAVDKSGFSGVRSLWSPLTPGCAGANPQLSLPAGFQVPAGWLAPRGFYSAALDPDRRHAAGVTKALGTELAAEPYAVEAYDATLAVLTAARKVPGSLLRQDYPQEARRSLVEALPQAGSKGLLNTTWKTLSQASRHHDTWIDRAEKDGHWRQVSYRKG
jgi:hypothetical protein